MEATVSKQLIYTYTNRLLDWYTRPRSVGVQMLKYGALIVVATTGIDIAFQFARHSKNDNWSISFGTGQGLPLWSSLVIAGVGLLLAVIGALVMLVEYRRERRRRLVVIEMRGLHASPDTPAVDKVVPAFRGERRHLLLDFRPQGQNAHVDPTYLLERVSSMKGTLQSLVDGADKRDVQVAIGGLAAVPALFLAGMLIDDESHAHLYDWDRNAKHWRSLDGLDDSERFLSLVGLDTIGVASEVLLVLEASYSISPVDIATTFESLLPVLHLRVSNPLADRFWSEQKQSALAAQFRDAVQQVSALGVKKIHLVAATPSSFSLRLGMSYDRRLFPQVVVYQFEKDMPKPYPWGLQMPTVGTPLKIIRP